MRSFRLVSLKDFVPRAVELFSKESGKRYSWASFGKDCIAGFTVGVVALPLSMAFSIAAGGTPAQGLYTAIAAGFLISLLGGSKFQIAGPTGAFVVIIFGVISRHGMDGLITATILAGLILIAMGLTGLGRFVQFIPYPVTTGFTTGIGLLIFSQQIKDFFGLRPVSSSPAFVDMWKSYVASFATFRPETLALGLGTIAVIILVRKFIPRLPAAAAGVVAAAVVCRIFSLPVETIEMRFGAIPHTLPALALPDLSWTTIRDVLPDSFTIALLAAIESLLSAVVADGMTGDRHNANMELAAQGAGNIVSALCGGIPATGAIARTAANIKSGAASPVAGMIHALVLVLFIIFLAPLAGSIPLASLSAVLIVVSWDMSSLGRFGGIVARAPKSDALVLLVTFALTVLADLTFAVGVGLVLAAFLFLRRMAEVAGIRPGAETAAAEILYGTDNKNAETPGKAARIPDGIEVYEITGPFFFGVADSLQQVLSGIEKKPRAFVLRMKDVPAVDSTGIAALETFLAQCRRRKITLCLCEMREQPRKALSRAGFLRQMGEANVKDTLEDALAFLRDNPEN